MEDDAAVTGAAVADATPEVPTGNAGEPAPPATAAVDAPDAGSVPAADPEAEPVLADDHSNLDEWLAWSERKINADAAREEREAAQAALVAPTAGESVPPPEPKPGAHIDAAATAAAPAPDPVAPVLTPEQIEAAKAAGYTIEPPSPPPDPFASLTAKLAPHIGEEAYAQAKADALQVIDDADPDWVAKDQKRTQAIARMQAIEQNRSIANDTYVWARQQIANEDAHALAELVSRQPSIDRAVLDGTQGLGPILKAAETAAATAAAAAKESEWQAKYEARETYWKGEVARAKADKLVADTGAVARSPQAGGIPGGKAGRAGPLYETIPGTDLPTEKAIQDMIAGKFAHIDLSD